MLNKNANIFTTMFIVDYLLWWDKIFPIMVIGYKLGYVINNHKILILTFTQSESTTF